MIYKTSRLSVVEFFKATSETQMLVSIMELLTPNVVQSLPPYFQNIDSISDAQNWLDKMVSQSRLFKVVHVGSNTTIGFIFVYPGNDAQAHIGYLLGEPYWGKGYATELLIGLIDFLERENNIKRLIAGVATNNIVSSTLLQKLGFVKGEGESKETIFYEYELSST
jgi:RimJ/RimL family protein N-acetyltransferase